VIDAQNHRVGRKVNGVLDRGWLYQSQLAPVAELDGSGQVVSRFVYATRGNVPDYLVRADGTYRLVLDQLESVRLVVHTQTGVVAQRLDYDEFGRVTQNTSPGFQPFGFAGGLYDNQTGLVRFGARDYDATTGRWTAKDPLGFSGLQLNLYTYAGNDGVNFVDQSGRIPLPIVTGLIGAGISAGVNIYSQIASGGDFSLARLGVAAGVGFVAGAVAPYTGGSWLALAGVGAAANAIDNVGGDLAAGELPNGGDAVIAAVTGFVGGAFAGPFTRGSAAADEAAWALMQYGRRMGMTAKRFNYLVALEAQVTIGALGRNLLGALFGGAPFGVPCESQR
jgi:RHS repeat-associated protein